MFIDQLVIDGVKSASLIKDVTSFLKPIVGNLQKNGAKVEFPEIRLNARRSTLEYTAGIVFNENHFKSGNLKLNVPTPSRVSLYSFEPYMQRNEAITILDNTLIIDTKKVEVDDYKFRLELEYPLQDSKALNSLVHTNSPAETYYDDQGNDFQRYWLHAELKTVDFLREVYKQVRIEELEVMVEVTIKEDIKSAINPEMRWDIETMAKLGSHDRNEQMRALMYRKHHPIPKFKGDIFKAMRSVQDLFLPSKFKRFLLLEGPYRLGDCTRGTTLGDMYQPLYLPQSMNVYSETDLTLDKPAREGKLVFNKSTFAKKLMDAIKDSK